MKKPSLRQTVVAVWLITFIGALPFAISQLESGEAFNGYAYCYVLLLVSPWRLIFGRILDTFGIAHQGTGWFLLRSSIGALINVSILWKGLRSWKYANNLDRTNGSGPLSVERNIPGPGILEILRFL